MQCFCPLAHVKVVYGMVQCLLQEGADMHKRPVAVVEIDMVPQIFVSIADIVNPSTSL